MKNKKGRWEFDYNGQIAVDEYKGIIFASYLTNNPSDHHELIPLMEQVKSNLTAIFDEMPSNFQVSADKEYSTDAKTEYLKENGLDGHISLRKLAKETKKIQYFRRILRKRQFYLRQ